MDNQEQLAGLHSEHANWQNQILRYKGELQEMKVELAGIVSKLPPREVPAAAEHFQNQFILQRDVLDIMRHDFKQYENKIEFHQKSGNKTNDSLFGIRDAYKVRLSDYDKIFHELKNEFELFKKTDAIPAWIRVSPPEGQQ